MRTVVRIWKSFARWEALLLLAHPRGRDLELDAVALSSSSAANLLDVTTPYIFLGLLAFGLTFVVVAGEIDISVASTMTVAAVVIARRSGTPA